MKTYKTNIAAVSRLNFFMNVALYILIYQAQIICSNIGNTDSLHHGVDVCCAYYFNGDLNIYYKSIQNHSPTYQMIFTKSYNIELILKATRFVQPADIIFVSEFWSDKSNGSGTFNKLTVEVKLTLRKLLLLPTTLVVLVNTKNRDIIAYSHTNGNINKNVNYVISILQWIIFSVFLTKLNKLNVSFLEAVHEAILVFGLETRCPINIQKSKWMYITLVIGGILFWTRYEMELGSLVTVKEKPHAFETKDELFENEFRILYNGNCDNVSKEYICFSKKSSLSESEYLMNFVTQKVAWVIQGRWLNWYLPLERAKFKKIKSLIECFNVEEEQNLQPYFLVVNMVNRYWILETMQRIDQAGLVNKWDELAQFATSNQNRETFIEPQAEKLPDLIDISRILAVMCLWSILVICTICVFILEYIFSLLFAQ